MPSHDFQDVTRVVYWQKLSNMSQSQFSTNPQGTKKKRNF